LNKEEVIKILQECIRTEESAIVLYTRHIESTFAVSGLDSAWQMKISSTLGVLSKDSQRHKQTFEKVLVQVKESEKDVY